MTTGIPRWEDALNEGAMSPDEFSAKLLDLSHRLQNLVHAVSDIEVHLPD